MIAFLIIYSSEYSAATVSAHKVGGWDADVLYFDAHIKILKLCKKKHFYNNKMGE